MLDSNIIGPAAWPELTEPAAWRRKCGTLTAGVKTCLIDEFSIALSPVLFGSRIRLFEDVDGGRVALEPVRAEPTQRVTPLTYAVRGR